jgi:DNA mismatch repair protein MutL
LPIKLLPPRLANQIAAGEVVERPASVVKELIENSLDAGASKIELDIEKGGHKRIKIRDNGCGIPKEELELALSRHATSKIATLDDLEQILSLGFRGEALASISSVSRLTLSSKPLEQEQAWQAQCEGRDMVVKFSPVAHPNGTTIDVADLFYNTPARRKFLRTEKTEFQHIEDTCKRIALSRPDVTLVLRHNGKIVKRYNATDSQGLEQRVAAVCGANFVKHALYVHTEYDGIELHGWLGDESQMRSSYDCQFSFVNGRSMRDKLILHAIRQAYESVLETAEQPSFVIYLDINPKDVDVNVHPAKNEVRFQQSRLIHDFICKAVCDALAEGCEAPRVNTEPSHDYIQPLQRDAATENKYAGAGPRQETFAGGSNVGFAGRLANENTRPSGAYQQHYQRLMETDSDSDNNPINYFSLSDEYRLYHLQDQCFLLHRDAVLKPWFTSQCQQSSPSQPLLMPVAVGGTIAQDCLAFLTDSGFDIVQQHGKSRLMSVPAQWRHFPWISLFPQIMNTMPTTEVVLISVFISYKSWDSNFYRQAWHWFDNLGQSQQDELLPQLGCAKSMNDILAFWQDKT